MNLTEEETKMLEGEQGGLIKGAMEFLVKLGEIYGATKMVDINFAFIYTAMSRWRKEKFSETLCKDTLYEALNRGVKVKVPTFVMSFEADLNYWQEYGIPEEKMEDIKEDLKFTRQLGMTPMPTCAPYLVSDIYYHPLRTHITCVESSAITYYNSILGARTNRDGISAFYSSLTGKYPKFGYHIEENRAGDCLIEVEADLESDLDYGKIGFLVGKHVGADVPVFTGIHSPKTRDLMALSSSLATGGAVSMFHIVGVTPEAPTLNEAFQSNIPKNQIKITSKDLDQAMKNYSKTEKSKVDFIALGCPYYSIHEIKQVAEFLKGEKIHENVLLWVMTDPQTRNLAENSGYAEAIYQAGGKIIAGTCPITNVGKPGPGYAREHSEYSVGNMATDSVKQAYYAEPILNAKAVFLGDTEKCLRAAISGIWS